MKITASYIVNINTSISRAIKLLQDNEIKILSVTDKKRILLGTITDGDIRRGLIKGITINDCCSKIMNKRPCFALRNELDKINYLLLKYSSIYAEYEKYTGKISNLNNVSIFNIITHSSKFEISLNNCN